MPKRNADMPEPSNAEWAVLNALWDAGPMAAGEIFKIVERERDWSYSTVRTLLTRLVEKGWLDARRVGNSYLYSAAVPRRKAVRSAVHEFTGRVLDGLLSPFVAYYAEEHDLSEEDLRRLEEIIRRHKNKGGK